MQSATSVRAIAAGGLAFFLDCIDKNEYASPQEYAQLVGMFQKVLRRYNCGKPLPENTYGLADVVFPVVPQEDANLWMGVWTESEVSFIIRFIHSLLEQHSPFFTAPTGTLSIPDSHRHSLALDDPLLKQMFLQENDLGREGAGLASGMTDAEWNEWVYQMLRNGAKITYPDSGVKGTAL